MPRPLATAWAALQRIYGVGGQLQAPQDIEYGVPVQIVHDASVEAEYGASVILAEAFSLVTAGAGAPAFSTRTLDDIFTGAFGTRLAQLGRRQLNSEVYLLSITVEAAANLDSVAVGIRPPDTGRRARAATTTDVRMVFFANNADSEMVIVSGGATQLTYKDAGTGIFDGTHPASCKLPQSMDELLVRAEDNSGGALTATFKPIYAVMPLGAGHLPPG